MAIQRHPVESFDLKTNFWEEFPDYKIHPTFGIIWKLNHKDKLIKSSLFMWALCLCYDRKSSLYNQPEIDKWEVSSEQLFGDPDALRNFYLYDLGSEDNPYENEKEPIITLPMNLSFRTVIAEFERSIDTPMGLSLRELERKLAERTDFIMNTPYTVDGFTLDEKTKRHMPTKGTAEQLDKMFERTDKINSLIAKAMDTLKSADGQGTVKGGQAESLGDGNNTF